jgi:hypothetical protein
MRERLVEAWVADTGIHPKEACVVAKVGGDKVKLWVEQHVDFCETHNTEIKRMNAVILSLTKTISELHVSLGEMGKEVNAQRPLAEVISKLTDASGNVQLGYVKNIIDALRCFADIRVRKAGDLVIAEAAQWEKFNRAIDGLRSKYV